MFLFARLGLFYQVFGHVKEWLTLKPHRITRVSHIFRKSLILCIFSCLGAYLHHLGRSWSGLYQGCMQSHLIARPMVFILLSARARQGEVLTLMKED